ncbi:FHA domain-containing protein [Streptomyces sp. ME02-6991-2A]|uniref:FHA domain-containing protein n=1 Tax=Streptomyces sp. ME02-6991-2A TaxID=3028677 RepID=UPI0029B13A1F|nr:FHA domain-containing protein [Streptomyces sp. ME02-6991-2A]MDX3374953.1 FHA domain-containing protein [Streptomyces sp. ME02-6991-2A]
MPTCPNGHQSGSEDWCEVCGHRMTGTGAPAGAVPPPPPPPPAPGYGYPPPASDDGGPATMQAELCPQCRTPREANAPYCEECRWNFLTNTATSYTPLAPQPGAPSGPPPGLNLPPGFLAQQGPGGQGGQGGQSGPGGQGGPAGLGGAGGPGGPGGPGGAPRPQQHDPFEFQASRPSQVNRPAEPLAPEQTGHGSQTGHGGQGGHGGQDERGGQGGPPPNAFQQGPPPPPVFQQQGPPPSHQQQSAPSPFEPQQSSPFAPPQQHRSAPPQQQSPHGGGGGGDDWVLPPPSQAQAQAPQQAQQPPQAFQQQASYQGQGQQQGGHPDQQQGNQGYGQDQGYGQVPGQGQQQPTAATTWTAVIAPDREYFLAMMQRSGPEATGLNLPAYSPEQRLPLTGSQVTIGRRRHSTGESPDIDLSVPPEDPGVSHQHAVLVQQPDGGWSVVDQKSTNGTTLNGADEPIQPYVPVPLQDGDQVHVGAWTTITIRRD